jgi:hypothetical protein
MRLVIPSQRNQRDPDERRSHPRHTLAELPWLREVRLKYGPRAALIDLSSSGAQLETAGYRLNPGSTVVVEIAGEADGSPIPSRVVRSHISGLMPEPVYRVAVEFKRTLVIAAPNAPRLGADLNPVHQHARLLLALRRFEGWVPGRDRAANPVLASEGQPRIDAMSAVLAMIDGPAARRAGPAFARELAMLFSIVTQGIEEEASEDTLIRRLVDRLRRTIPVRALRLSNTLAVSERDAIYFDVPTSDSQPSAKLIVELPRDFKFEEWQFHYLKAAAHFFTLVRQLEQRRAAPPSPETVMQEARPVEEAKPLEREDGAVPLSRVVVRYRDGRLLKGFLRDFLPSRGVAEIWPSLDAPPTSRVGVPLGQLKAIFFVRDFDGDATYARGESSASLSPGRKIVVTFLDGEELTGVTLTYKPEASGFMVTPLDGGDNNTRVFVVSQSIRHVQFP